VYFNAKDGDVLDLYALIDHSKGAVTAQNVGHYVKATTMGGDTVISVDGDGALNGGKFVDTLRIVGQTNLDVAKLFTSHNLVA